MADPKGNNASGGQPNVFEALPPAAQFAVLGSGVIVFFGIHNYLQEAIMSVPDFHYGVMLGYMEVLGVALCSLGERAVLVRRERAQQERQHQGGQYSSLPQNGSSNKSGQSSVTRRVAPMSAYPLLMGCLMTSSALSNMSLNYINFPTKVVFRSCKLIPTMLVARLLHNKVFSAAEYLCATAICCGLILFAAADWDLSPSFHPIGLAMVTLSVCADAVLPNAQERLFRMGASRLEVTLYTNIYTLAAMTLSTLASGDLQGALRQTVLSKRLQVYFFVYTFVAYVAISVHMTVVRRFGGVAAVLLATGRKGITLVLSFLLFPKAFSWFYPVGAALVLGGLLASSLLRIRAKGRGAATEGGDLELQRAAAARAKHKALKQRTSDIESPPPSRHAERL